MPKTSWKRFKHPTPNWTTQKFFSHAFRKLIFPKQLDCLAPFTLYVELKLMKCRKKFSIRLSIFMSCLGVCVFVDVVQWNVQWIQELRIIYRPTNQSWMLNAELAKNVHFDFFFTFFDFAFTNWKVLFVNRNAEHVRNTIINYGKSRNRYEGAAGKLWFVNSSRVCTTIKRWNKRNYLMNYIHIHILEFDWVIFGLGVNEVCVWVCE